MLLFSVTAHHLVFVLLHFLLSTFEGALLVQTENHVRLRLLHLEVLDAGHFAVFVNHLLNHVVDLLLLAKVLRVSFLFEFGTVSDLLLDQFFVPPELFHLSGLLVTRDLVLDFLGPKHDFVDLGVLLLHQLQPTSHLQFRFDGGTAAQPSTPLAPCSGTPPSLAFKALLVRLIKHKSFQFHVCASRHVV